MENENNTRNGVIRRVSCEPKRYKGNTGSSAEAIANAELIILGPGSLYTSVIPNLLIKGIVDAIWLEYAKNYVCNVVTQKEKQTAIQLVIILKLFCCMQEWQAIKQRNLLMLCLSMINNLIIAFMIQSNPIPVSYDKEKLANYDVEPICRSLLSPSSFGHHDPEKLRKQSCCGFMSIKYSSCKMVSY